MKSIIGAVVFMFVCTVFAVNVLADPKIETAYLDLTTQPVSELENVGDAFDVFNLSLNGRAMVTDKIGVEGSVSTPIKDIDGDTLTYNASVFGRLERKELGIEPYVDYTLSDNENLVMLGVRVGLINRR